MNNLLEADNLTHLDDDNRHFYLSELRRLENELDDMAFFVQDLQEEPRILRELLYDIGIDPDMPYSAMDRQIIRDALASVRNVAGVRA